MNSSNAPDRVDTKSWAPIVVVLCFYLVAGLDISLRGATDDRRLGYFFLALFALTATGAAVLGHRPRAMALLCFALVDIQIILAAVAISRGMIDVGLPFIVVATILIGMPAAAAIMFRRRSF